jgi:hypothetical protein
MISRDAPYAPSSTEWLVIGATDRVTHSPIQSLGQRAFLWDAMNGSEAVAIRDAVGLAVAGPSGPVAPEAVWLSGPGELRPGGCGCPNGRPCPLRRPR